MRQRCLGRGSHRDHATQHGKVHHAEHISSDTPTRAALARSQFVFERGPGVSKVALPESARDGNRQGASRHRGRRRRSGDQPGRGDDVRFPEGDDDDQAVALDEMTRVEIPSFELVTDAGRHASGAIAMLHHRY